VRFEGLIEEEAPHRVYDLRYGLAVGESLKAARHAVCPHEGARGEGEWDSQIKPANCTASTLRIRSPMVIPIHENAKLRTDSGLR
jgi:hypothetical protein